MAKVTGPLLSLGGSGSIAKTQVYAKWKGRPYVRRHVIPSNPDTAEQQLTRTVFGWLNGVWKNAPALVSEVWDRFAVGQVLTGRNAFIGQNTRALRIMTDLNDMIMSPGAKGGPPAVSVVNTPGIDQISTAVTVPAAPTGWTLTSAIVAVIRDQDPQTEVLYAITAGEDLTAPYTVVNAGLDSGELYQVFAWLKWEKPDGSVAYGASIQSTSTPT